MGVSRASRHRGARGRKARRRAQGAVRSPLGRGPRRQRAAAVRARRRYAAGRRAGMHRLGGIHGHRRRPLVLEQEHARQRSQDRVDPPGRRRRGAAEGGPEPGRRHRAAVRSEPAQPGRRRRPAAPGRGRNAPRQPHQRLANLGHASATRRPAVLDPRRFQQRPLPAAPAEHRHDRPRLRRADARSRRRDQRRRRLRLVPPECAAEGLAAGERAAGARRAAGAGTRDARRRGLRPPLPRGHFCLRPRRRNLGRRVAAQGHARLLQRCRPRSLYLERRQPLGGADGRRAHAPGGRRARRSRRPRQPRAGDRRGDRSRRRDADSAHARGAARARRVRRVQEQRLRASRRRHSRHARSGDAAHANAGPDAGARARPGPRIDAALSRRDRAVHRRRLFRRHQRHRRRLRPRGHVERRDRRR